MNVEIYYVWTFQVALKMLLLIRHKITLGFGADFLSTEALNGFNHATPWGNEAYNPSIRSQTRDIYTFRVFLSIGVTWLALTKLRPNLCLYNARQNLTKNRKCHE